MQVKILEFLHDMQKNGGNYNMKKDNKLEVKFITKDKNILDIERGINSDTYFTKRYKSDVLDYDKLYLYASYKLELDNIAQGKIPENIMPSAILSKIPDELLERIYSLEVVFTSSKDTIKFFPEEKASNMGVVVVKLYAIRDDSNTKKVNVSNWPSKEDILPIGMTQNEFDSLKEYFEIY